MCAKQTRQVTNFNHMKRVDKLILRAFSGPFVLVFAVILFIFLTQYMIKNFKYFVGKDLGFDVFGELFFYFSLVMVPLALPLAILFSSLMTFGNLGQHSELTALKSAGISLTRMLIPVGVVVVIITGLSLLYNDRVVPYANLKAYRLLYDIKQKKPTLDIEEGAFYNGIEGYSIKVDKKLDDDRSLEGVMIYNHEKKKGNKEVIIAKKGVMDNVSGGDFLKFTLLDGESFSEIKSKNKNNLKAVEYVRNKFDSGVIYFDLSSFALKETREDLFKGHNIMKREAALIVEKDSLVNVYQHQKDEFTSDIMSFFTFYKTSTIDSTEQLHQKQLLAKSIAPNLDSDKSKYRIYLNAVNRANTIQSKLKARKKRETHQDRTIVDYAMNIYKRYTQAIAILVMFLIGAPLGAIIKKGGLGIPVLVSVVFFVIYYITSISGDRLAKEFVLEPVWGSWGANIILFVIGVFLFIQAYRDVRLFDKDYYTIILNKLFSKKS